MSYAPDPGQVFASDTHRRTLGHLSVPDLRWNTADLYARMVPDKDTDHADEQEVIEVLSDLEADGYVDNSPDGWAMTAAGLTAIQAGPSQGEDH